MSAVYSPHAHSHTKLAFANSIRCGDSALDELLIGAFVRWRGWLRRGFGGEMVWGRGGWCLGEVGRGREKGGGRSRGIGRRRRRTCCCVLIRMGGSMNDGCVIWSQGFGRSGEL